MVGGVKKKKRVGDRLNGAFWTWINIHLCSLSALIKSSGRNASFEWFSDYFKWSSEWWTKTPLTKDPEN
jgi:hypothetical protein